MGYTTDFEGEFDVTPELDDATYQFLVKFNETRRMARDLPAEYGVQGEFYVDGSGMAGQARESSIVDYNRPPSTQPGLWCQWRPTDDRKHLAWDEGEKFYEYEAWLRYLIDNILAPRGYIVDGRVLWQGEDRSDLGALTVKDNIVTSAVGRVVYEEG